MDLVTLSGGLGNQMFQFAFYWALKKRGKKVFLYKNKLAAKEHNGYELQTLFGVEEKCVDGLWMTRLLGCPLLGKILKHILFPHKIRERVLYNYSIYLPLFERNGLHWVGYWQSEKYFQDVADDIRHIFCFDHLSLNPATSAALKCMSEQVAVSVHIRRGDYYLPCNVATYGGLCTVEYYENAIRYVKERYPQAVFYVFSDDLDWVRENIPSAVKMVFVDWNRGKDSWQDMFLMSKCHHNILANSSFSWWGAWLNTHPEKLVIAPERWANCPAPDALPDGWVRIEGVSRT